MGTFFEKGKNGGLFDITFLFLSTKLIKSNKF